LACPFTDRRAGNVSKTPGSGHRDRRPQVAGNIGALITGVDIAKPLDPQVVAEVRQALLAHKVIFFRGQDLDHAAQNAFARQFGETVPEFGGDTRWTKLVAAYEGLSEPLQRLADGAESAGRR
jgi:alpha-ketoglutarate-dependent taurine dioxygenase